MLSLLVATLVSAASAAQILRPSIVLPVIAVVIIVFGVIYLLKRTRRRPCPRCGRPVEVGVLDCDECGFDFRAV